MDGACPPRLISLIRAGARVHGRRLSSERRGRGGRGARGRACAAGGRGRGPGRGALISILTSRLLPAPLLSHLRRPSPRSPASPGPRSRPRPRPGSPHRSAHPAPPPRPRTAPPAPGFPKGNASQVQDARRHRTPSTCKNTGWRRSGPENGSFRAKRRGSDSLPPPLPRPLTPSLPCPRAQGEGAGTWDPAQAAGPRIPGCPARLSAQRAPSPRPGPLPGHPGPLPRQPGPLPRQRRSPGWPRGGMPVPAHRPSRGAGQPAVTREQESETCGSQRRAKGPASRAARSQGSILAASSGLVS